MAQTSYNTSMTIGIQGQLADAADNTIVTAFNEESSAEMPFGHALVRGSADNGALLPDNTSDKLLGILLHSHNYDPDSQLGDDGVLPDETLSVLRKGRVLAKCIDGCSPGDGLFVRCVTAGNEQEGELRASSDSTDCIDATNMGTWQTTASAGGLAWLEVDFTTGSPNIGS